MFMLTQEAKIDAAERYVASCVTLVKLGSVSNTFGKCFQSRSPV